MFSKLSAEQGEKVLSIKGETPSLLRIKAILKAYGTGYNFVSFYANEDFSVLICLQDSLAVLHMENGDDKVALIDVVEFLPMVAKTILCEVSLPMDSLIKHGFETEQGSLFRLDKYEHMTLPEVSGDIQAAFDISSAVFNEVNEEDFNSWYTDLSHRIRHGMSAVFTLKGICTATSFLCEEDIMLLAQLATLPAMRGRGYARKILFHTATAVKAKSILLLSQNKESDSFYIKLGFQKTGEWYLYSL